MATDLRNLPEPVRARLVDGYGEDFLSERHRGFDIDYKGKTLEHRATPRVELRTDTDGAPVIVGYAAVYEHTYDVAGGPEKYGWTETVGRGAPDKSIEERDEVYLFFDHEGLPLAATKAGTLTLESDKIGLFNESRPDPRSQYSMEVVHRLERKELDAMSWAFQAIRQEWNDDYTERRITEAKIFDVSVVSFPANPATVVQLRSAVRSNMAELRSIWPELSGLSA